MFVITVVNKTTEATDYYLMSRAMITFQPDTETKVEELNDAWLEEHFGGMAMLVSN